MKPRLSYKKAGVDIHNADRTKKEMSKSLSGKNPRVLNKFGAFASLLDGHFPNLKHPVLVMKTEEPGSKQKLAFDNNRIESICQDMINHLINDIAVMGATPLFVQDAIICGKLEKEKVKRAVKAISEACRTQGCALTGGETSEQPGVLAAGTYILSSSVVGVVDKANIIDGSRIKEGDAIIALASSGLHTNGYSLVRALLKENPKLAKVKIDGQTFLDTILIPHACYFSLIKKLFAHRALHGMAHITGGGIAGNLNRVLPKGCDARIALEKIRVLPVFHKIKRWGNVPDQEMLKTFNMGVGMTLVVDKAKTGEILARLNGKVDANVIGDIVKGNQTVNYEGKIKWL